MNNRSNDLAKEIEEGRAARRARAKAAVATGHVIQQPEATPAPATPVPSRRRYSRRRVEQHIREIEAGIKDCLGDFPEVGEDDITHDIAWSILYGLKEWEHPQVVAELARRYDVTLDGIDPLFGEGQ
jgi:hypothetical protein